MIDFVSAEEEFLFYKESAIEDCLMEHQSEDLFSMYEMAYLEEGEDAAKGVKGKGIGAKLIEGIGKIIAKIQEGLRGFIESIKALTISKEKRISGEDLMNSESIQADLKADIAAMQKQVDEEYRAMRPLVSSVQAITGMDGEKVEQLCDHVDSLLQNKYREVRQMALKSSETFNVKKFIAKRLGNYYIRNSEDIKKFTKEADEYRLKIKARELSDIDFKNMKKIDRVLYTVNRLTQKWERGYRDVKRKVGI